MSIQRMELPSNCLTSFAVDMGNSTSIKWVRWSNTCKGGYYTERYPELAVLGRLARGTVLDGELVMLEDGRADFHVLMSRHRRRPRLGLPFFAPAAHYIVFDLLYHRGRSLLDWPLMGAAPAI